MQDEQSINKILINDLSFAGDRNKGHKMYRDYCWSCYVTFNYFDFLEKHRVALRKNENLKPYYVMTRNKLREFYEYFDGLVKEGTTCQCDTGELPVAYEDPITEEVVQYDVWGHPLLLHYDYLQLDPYGLLHLTENEQEQEEEQQEQEQQQQEQQQEQQEETTTHVDDDGWPVRHMSFGDIMFRDMTDEEIEEIQDMANQMDVAGGNFNIFEDNHIPEHHPTLVRLIEQGQQQLPSVTGASIYSSEYRVNYRLSQKNFLLKTYGVVDTDNIFETTTRVRVYRDIPALLKEIKFWLDYFSKPHDTILMSTIFSLQNKLHGDCIYTITTFIE